MLPWQLLFVLWKLDALVSIYTRILVIQVSFFAKRCIWLAIELIGLTSMSRLFSLYILLFSSPQAGRYFGYVLLYYVYVLLAWHCHYYHSAQRKSESYITKSCLLYHSNRGSFIFIEPNTSKSYVLLSQVLYCLHTYNVIYSKIIFFSPVANAIIFHQCIVFIIYLLDKLLYAFLINNNWCHRSNIYISQLCHVVICVLI